MTNMNELLYMIHQNDEYALVELLNEVKDIVFFDMKRLFYERNNIDIRPYFDDILQECNITIIDAINSFREDKEANFNTFVKKCINNKGLTLLRYIKGNHYRLHLNSISLDSTIQEHEETYRYEMIEQRDCLVNPVYAYEFKEVNKRFEDYYNNLSELDQKILLSYIKNESYIEAANKLNITTKSYDNRLQRIKRRIKVAIYSD